MQKYSDLKKYYHFSNTSAAAMPLQNGHRSPPPPSSAPFVKNTVYSPLAQGESYVKSPYSNNTETAQYKGSRNIFYTILTIIALGSFIYIRNQALYNQNSVYHDFYNIFESHFGTLSFSFFSFPKPRAHEVELSIQNSAVPIPQSPQSAQSPQSTQSLQSAQSLQAPQNTIPIDPAAATSQPSSQSAAPQTTSQLTSQTTQATSQLTPQSPSQSALLQPPHKELPSKERAPSQLGARQSSSLATLDTPSKKANNLATTQGNPSAVRKQTTVTEENGKIIVKSSPHRPEAIIKQEIPSAPTSQSIPSQLSPPNSVDSSVSLANTDKQAPSPSNQLTNSNRPHTQNTTHSDLQPQQPSLNPPAVQSSSKQAAQTKTAPIIDRTQSIPGLLATPKRSLAGGNPVLKTMQIFIPILKADKGTVLLTKKTISLGAPINPRVKLFEKVIDKVVRTDYASLGGLDFFSERIKVNRIWIENQTLIIDVNRNFEYSRYGRKALEVRLQLLLWGILAINDQLTRTGDTISYVSLLIDGRRKSKLGGDGWVLNPFYSISDLKTTVSFLQK